MCNLEENFKLIYLKKINLIMPMGSNIASLVNKHFTSEFKIYL